MQSGATGAHEATALRDVRTAVDSAREVKPVEQHIHSFLESLPFGWPAAIMCLHADQVKSLLRGGCGNHPRAASRAAPATSCRVPTGQASASPSAPACCCRTARS
ncbi:hypothetical protein AB5J55_34860 [Streptomyces sp. R11]|uniref:Uncharacterized protein n=1 Tax=Streptomyces sp. R11 TaxID=3238625 RepID=A0AB39N992_9ACTN